MSFPSDSPFYEKRDLEFPENTPVIKDASAQGVKATPSSEELWDWYGIINRICEQDHIGEYDWEDLREVRDQLSEHIS